MIGYGYGYGVNLGALLNQTYPWMLLPYFALPATGLKLLAGETVTIYGDSLINVPISNNLNVTYVSEIGTQSGNNLLITTPTAGSYTCVATFKNGTTLIGEYTFNITVVAKKTAGSIYALFVGDSLIEGGMQYIAPKVNTILSPCTVNYIGTKGTTYKHEGIGGASFSSLITTGSPFVKSGALNIPAYFQDNGLLIPDVVVIRLGINDTFDQCAAGGDGLTDAEIATIINNAKTFVTGFLNLEPNVKIVLSIPTISENSGAGWNANYDEATYLQDLYIQNIHKYTLALVTEFANGTYNARVDVDYGTINLDRDDGYGKIDGVHINGIHPDQSGYEQLAFAAAETLNRRMLGVNIIPANASSFSEEAGVSYWAPKAGATLAYNVGEWMEFYAIAAGYGSYFWKSSGVVATGKTYKWMFKAKSVSYTGKISITAGSAASTPALTHNLSTNWATYVGVVSPVVGTDFTFYNANPMDEIIDVDDIIVREVI